MELWMRHVGLLSILVTVVAGPTLAQAPDEVESGPAEQAAQRLTEELAPALGLTGEQIPPFEEAIHELILGQQEILAEHSEDDLDQVSIQLMQHELDTAQDRAMDRLAGVLTEKQTTSLEAALQRQRAQVVGDAMVQRLREPLELSGKQQEQLLPVFTHNLHARYKAALKMRAKSRYNSAVTDFWNTTQALQKQLVDELRTVLTSEQLTAYFKVADQMRSLPDRSSMEP